jgi:hypothetical protein
MRWHKVFYAANAKVAPELPQKRFSTKKAPSLKVKCLFYMVRPDRVERPTFWFVAQCSIQAAQLSINGSFYRSGKAEHFVFFKMKLSEPEPP